MWRRVHDELSSRPMAVVAAPFVGGIVAGSLTNIPLAACVAAALAAVGGLIFTRGLMRLFFIALLGLSAGAARQEAWERISPNDVSRVPEGANVLVRGRAVDADRRYERLDDVKERHDPPTGSFALDVDRLEIDGRGTDFTGR